MTKSRVYVVLDVDFEDGEEADPQYLRDWLGALTAEDGSVVAVYTDPEAYLRAVKANTFRGEHGRIKANASTSSAPARRGLRLTP